MEPNKNKVPKEMPNNFNSTTKKKEGGLSNSSESKGDPNTSSKNLLKDLAKKFNSPNEENTIKDPNEECKSIHGQRKNFLSIYIGDLVR